VFRRTFAALGRQVSEDGQVARGVAALHDAFVRACVLAPDTVAVLSDLRRRGLALGMLSNYSLAPAIRDSLRRLGIESFFDAVLVSADLGIVKPEPALFARIAADLGLPPRDILLVGDNLKADVAGGAAAGMRTAHVTEHLGGAYFFVHPAENHAEVTPDLVLPRLIDLVDRR
jgi:putative hydrolase of the HAD superfamily